jgi:hypothetical protein
LKASKLNMLRCIPQKGYSFISNMSNMDRNIKTNVGSKLVFFISLCVRQAVYE